MPASTRSGTTASVRKALLLCVVIPALVALPVWAFAWASADPQPNDLPIGVAGPSEGTSAIQERMAENEGAFDVHTYDSATDARAAIEDREIYGAIVASDQGTELLTASAASPAVAQSLTAMFAAPDGAQDQPPATVTDVVPADADDPRGSALGSLVLPLVLVSVITSIIVLLTAKPGWQQVLMIGAAALIGGLVAVAIAQGGLGVIGGNWLANVAAPALTVAAIASTIVGMASAFGRAGIAMVAPLMLFFGNPWSGATSSPYLLPEPAGLIGQLLPPGAGSTVLRSTSFFDGAGAGSAITVLLVWIALGLCGITIGVLRRRHPAEEVKSMAAPLAEALRA